MSVARDTTAAVVVNALYPDVFSSGEQEELVRLVLSGDIAEAAVQAARSHSFRRSSQEREIQRLAAGVDAHLVQLPFLFAAELDIDAISQLAGLLEPALEAIP